MNTDTRLQNAISRGVAKMNAAAIAAATLKAWRGMALASLTSAMLKNTELERVRDEYDAIIERLRKTSSGDFARRQINSILSAHDRRHGRRSSR